MTNQEFLEACRSGNMELITILLNNGFSEINCKDIFIHRTYHILISHIYGVYIGF